jgi:hypothetical protein
MAEFDEIKEQAERVEQDSSLLPISFSAAVLAVLVAMVTLLGHRAHTEELLLQSKATDIWSEYQAKSIRESTSRSFAQALTVLTANNAEAAKKLGEDFKSRAEGFSKDKEALKEKATEFEREQRSVAQQANRFDLGEALLEMALVITSVTLITKRRGFWYFGLLVGTAGVATAVVGLLHH